MAGKKKRRWLKVIGYPIFFLLILIPSLFNTFPFERVKGRVLREAEKRSGYRIEVALMEPSLLGGLDLTNVRLYEKARRGRAVEGKPKPTFAFEQVSIQLGLLALLAGDITVSVSTDLFGGELSGTYGEETGGTGIEVRWSDLDLKKAKALEDYTGVEVGGIASGEAHVVLDKGRLSKANGELSVRFEQAMILGGKVRGFQLPPIQIGDLDLSAKVDKGRVSLKKLEAESPDINAQVEGTLSLSDKIENSRLNLKTIFGFSDKFLEKNKAIKGGLSLIQRAKGKDGRYGYRLTGPIRRPTPRAWRR